VLALACALGAGRCGGSGGRSVSSDVTLSGDVSQVCSVEGLSNVYTPGTKAQTAVSTPPGTRLQSVAVDNKYAVWTQFGGRSGSGVVCQQNLATRAVEALARGSVVPLGIASTPQAVYFVTAGDRGPTLYAVDHRASRAREVAAGITTPISASGPYVAFSDQPEKGVERVSVVNSSQKNALAGRFRFDTCSNGVCAPVVSVSMIPNGVAWMRGGDQAGRESILSVRPFRGKSVTRALSKQDAQLVPSDNYPVFSDSDPTGYSAWLIDTGRRQPLGSFGGDELLALGAGDYFTLHTGRNGRQTVRAFSATTGNEHDLDQLWQIIRARRAVPVLGGLAAGPDRFCEIVNVFDTATPSDTDLPSQAYLRCGLAPL
jgi:hypothetical protein